MRLVALTSRNRKEPHAINPDMVAFVHNDGGKATVYFSAVCSEHGILGVELEEAYNDVVLALVGMI